MQRREPPVAPARQVRGDDVGVQLRVKRTAHPVAVRRRDQALGALDGYALRPRRTITAVSSDPPSAALTASSWQATSSPETSSPAIANRTLSDFGAENVRSSAATLGSRRGTQAHRGPWDRAPAISALNCSALTRPESPSASRPGPHPLAGRLAAARVVVVAAAARPAARSSGAGRDDLADREHQTALPRAGTPLSATKQVERDVGAVIGWLERG